MNPAVLWLLLRPRSLSGGHAALQVVGSAVTTVLAFATAILATRFWSITAADGAPPGSGASPRPMVVTASSPWCSSGCFSCRL